MKAKIICGIVCFILIQQIALAQNLNTVDVNISNQYGVSQNENSVCIDPINTSLILNANNAQNYPSPLGIGIFSTTNGGQNWTDINSYINTNTCCDPSCTIDLNGTNYISRNASNGISLHWFAQNNNNLNNIDVAYAAIGHSYDKSNIWVDNNINSPNVNNVYLVCSDFFGNIAPVGNIAITKANINSISLWSNPILISNNSQINAGYLNHGANVKTSSDGKVFVIWSIYDSPFVNSNSTNESAIGFAKLDGNTLATLDIKRIQMHDINSSPISIEGIRGTGIIGNSGARVNSFPNLAINQQNNHIYISWVNKGEVGINNGDPDIYFTKSMDDGLTWSVPNRVNHDLLNNGFNQFNSNMACDPITGVIAIIYYNDLNTSPLLETYVALSSDEGITWTEFAVSDNSFYFPAVANDYLGIDIKNNVVVPVWTTQNTDVQHAPTDAITSPFDISCENDINLCNINENAFNFYKASNTINVAGTTCFYNILNNGGDVIMQAGNYVHLGDNFHSEYGSQMHAFININCSNFSIANNNISRGSNIPNSEIERSLVKKTKIKVYPHPFDNILNFDYWVEPNTFEREIKLTIKNLFGNEVFSKKYNIKSGQNKFSINKSEIGLIEGIGFCIFESNELSETIKIVIIN